MTAAKLNPVTNARPLLTAVQMGYGHMRAADALARGMGLELLEIDRPPLADPSEQRVWRTSRRLYELASRASQIPWVGPPVQGLLNALTRIPHLYPFRDLSPPTMNVHTLQFLMKRGFGHTLVEELRRSGRPLLTTFFAPALIADHHGCPVYCVVTDADIARIWAPIDVARSTIRYFAPSPRVAKRLQSYGVPSSRIEMTGFPLPDELVGGHELTVLKRNLARRLVRLDPARAFRQQQGDEIAHFLGGLPSEADGAPRLTFAVGGAGAQAAMVRSFLPRLTPRILSGHLRLALVAGTRARVAEIFRDELESQELGGHPGVTILHEPDMLSYFRAFNALLADTDILWTKPSEITFFAALGLPLVFTSPVGVHERYNRRWAVENGAGIAQRDPRYAAEWLAEWLEDGTLAGTAWSGFTRMPKFGLQRIERSLRGA